MIDKIDYRRLKKDLLKKLGAYGIMPFIVSVNSESEKELIRLADEYNLDISDYIKD